MRFGRPVPTKSKNRGRNENNYSNLVAGIGSERGLSSKSRSFKVDVPESRGFRWFHIPRGGALRKPGLPPSPPGRAGWNKATFRNPVSPRTHSRSIASTDDNKSYARV